MALTQVQYPGLGTDVQTVVGYALGRNLIIGGDFSLNPWQRGTSFAAITNGVYFADRFAWGTSGAGVVTASRGSGGPDALSQNHLLITVTTADASIAAGDLYYVYHRIEGYNALRLGLGTALAQTFTLSFWVSSPVSGTHCVAFRNSAGNRSYVATYTINTINTWEFKTITVIGDTTGTWLYTNGIGLEITFVLVGGSTYQTTAGTWQAGNFMCTSGQVNVMGTNSNAFKMDRIQLELGSNATPFERLDYTTTLNRCQRYYEKSYDTGVNPGTASQNAGIYRTIIVQSGGTIASGQSYNSIRYAVRKRSTSTITCYGFQGNAGRWADTGGTDSPSPGSCSIAEQGETAFTPYNNAGGSITAPGGGLILFHYVADSEL